MEDLLTNLLTDSVTEKVTEVVIEATAETPVDSWGVFGFLLDTPGLAEGVAGAFGAPLAIIVGIKALRKWKKKNETTP